MRSFGKINLSLSLQDPLKFRKEKSDISETAGISRNRTETVTPYNNNNNTTGKQSSGGVKINLTKSCGDARLFNEARVKISTDQVNNKNDEKRRPVESEAAQKQEQNKVDETILFENNPTDMCVGHVNEPQQQRNNLNEDMSRSKKQLVDSSTNTVRTETREIGVQADSSEIVIETLGGFDRVFGSLFAKLYDDLENEAIDVAIEQILTTAVINSKAPIVVPDSPPREEVEQRFENSTSVSISEY